jgi:hypothetical protein
MPRPRYKPFVFCDIDIPARVLHLRSLLPGGNCSRLIVTSAMLNPDELDQITAEHVERRREPRLNQPAGVTVRVEQPGGGEEFHAVLVNASDGGFAIRHWRRDLLTGQKVRISDPSRGEIAASVMWNWAVGPVVISGLCREVVPTPSAHFHRMFDRPGPDESYSRFQGWAWAGLTGLIAAAAWYFRDKIL